MMAGVTYESHEADAIRARAAAAEEADNTEKKTNSDEDERQIIDNDGWRRHSVTVVFGVVTQ